MSEFLIAVLLVALFIVDMIYTAHVNKITKQYRDDIARIYEDIKSEKQEAQNE